MKLEQRKNNRVVFSVPVHYKVFQLENLESDVRNQVLGSKAEIQDLSQGGLQIVSRTPFKKGDVLELKLEIPGQGVVQTVAKVAWCEAPKDGENPGFRSGIQFIPVYEQDLQKLNEYLTKGKS